MSGSAHHHWTRRSFLKASLFSALALVGRPAWAQELTATSAPEGRLTLYNTHTHERLDVTYRQPSGEYDVEALSAIDQLLRCHYTNKATKMDAEVIKSVRHSPNQLGGRID